jgi:hypothetical protein
MNLLRAFGKALLVVGTTILVLVLIVLFMMWMSTLPHWAMLFVFALIAVLIVTTYIYLSEY